ncbi:hypothetical protein FOA52_005526 [Chlamydomonas sp. UWO 241]|nr:hypothetical protein FOA52_005526 [Chlamydomonas sp. UWO 241]
MLPGHCLCVRPPSQPRAEERPEAVAGPNATGTAALAGPGSFRKAYDTIDRGFLIAVMEAVGVGDGVLAWTRTILTHTYASAEVNGFISAPREYAAGVRQGCPAAPALFLFLGHALACFLRTCPALPNLLPYLGGGGAAGEPRWVGFAHGPGVVRKLTCKLAVALQLRAVVDERRVRRAATVEAALALDHGPHGGPRATDAQVFAGLRGMEAAVPTLWRMPLLNARKEPIWRLWPPARSVAVERAGELATMDLWDALASFAEGGVMPRGWAGVAGPTHPFVGVVDGGLTLNKTS